MKEHGVDVQIAAGGGDGEGTVQMASPGPGDDQANGGPPDEQTMRKAEEACRQYQPDGGDMPKPNPEEIEQFRKFAKCMRDNGVNMPDPDDDGRVTATAAPGDVQMDPNSDLVKKAEEACRQFRPSPRVMEGGHAG